MFECIECDYKSTSKDSLNKHMLIHMGEKDQNLHSSETSIDQLYAEVHIDPSQNGQTFECSVCHFKCSYKDIFDEHMCLQDEIDNKETPSHTGEKPFSCSECSESYESYEGLHSHMNSHIQKKSTKKSCHYTLVEELKCSECEYSTEIKADLKLHMKKHTGESPEKIIDQSFADIVMTPNGLTRGFNNCTFWAKCKKVKLNFVESTSWRDNQ